MYNFSFFILFFIVKVILSNNILSYLESNHNFIGIDYYINNTIEYIYENLIIKNNSFLKDEFFKDLSDTCINSFNNTFFNENNYIYYYKKLFFESSLNKNDIHSYYDCINNNYNNINFTYLTILINGNLTIYDELNSEKNDSSGYLIGLCIIGGCNKDEYKNIILKTINKDYFNIYTFNNNNSSNYNTSSTNIENDIISEIEIYELNSNNNNNSNGFIIFLEYLPFIIISIHIFLVLFNNIPKHLYNLAVCIFCCKTNNINSLKGSKLSNNSVKKKDKIKQSYKSIDNDRSPSYSNYSNVDNIHKSIDSLYNIKNNFLNLTIYRKHSEISNDSGLSYINGIKGISMIFLLFGSVYTGLYGSFLVEKEKEMFFYHLKNIFFTLFYVGIKYAPKLLLSTSGFSLFFKFICFLDGKVENEEEINRQREENLYNKIDFKNSINSNTNSNSNSNSFYRKLKKSGEKVIISKNKKIPYKYIFIFYVKQIHKYIIYILFFSFLFFSLNKIILLSEDENHIPVVWNFFNEKIINSAKKLQYLLPLLIGYKSYLIPGISNNDNENILDYCYLVFQEIIYFLFTTLIIFIGYKHNLRIDRFLKFIFILSFIFRIAFYVIYQLDDKDYFGYQKYGKFYTSIIYDYSFYIIGIHFGMINYIIQKGYSFRECSRQNKIYLINCLRMLKITKRKSKKYLLIISIISGFLLIISCFFQQFIMLFFNIDKNNNLEIYKEEIGTQILMFIDSDIFVLAFNFMACCLYIKGDNIINNILCHKLWSIFNRFYFSYILLINPIILYVIYVNETKIIFNISNCFLYSFICGFLVFSLSILIYISFELPLKKIIHFWIKLNEKVIIKERLSNVDGLYNNPQEELVNSATESITDFIGEDEEDEEEN